MDFRNKKVMVVGMAKSGISAAKLLLKLGAQVLLYDQKDKSAFALAGLLEQCQDYLGKDPMEAAAQADALVLSPGVPTRLDFIQEAYRRNIPVLSEIELGYQAAQADFVCVSGTNGKTTTTALTGEIFKNGGAKTYVLGNIGVPICDMALATQPGDTVVAEVAALQLETIDTFHPRAAALLNLTVDHMDRFGTMEYYTACKMRMFENQTSGDFAVMNLDDPLVKAQAGKVKSRLIWFSRKEKVENGAWVDAQGMIHFSLDNVDRIICHKDMVRIPGAHNLENALAAVCLASVMGISPKDIAYTLETFPGVEHRIEFVRTVNGVTFINDSKGTNPDATIKAIQAMKSDTVLILGGFDKHSDFDQLFATMDEKIKGAVVLGETKPKILAAAKKAAFGPMEEAEEFEEAVMKAYRMCPKGGTVLLSPACASWGMFRDFEQRGEVFKKIAEGISER